MGQDTVRTRKIERGTDLGLKAEKTALDWSHPGGRVVILLPLRWWRVSKYSSLFSFSEVIATHQQLLPLALILPVYIPLKE